MRATRAIIHLDHLAHNIKAIRHRVEGRPICLAVKADAYGHGIVAIGQAAQKLGVESLATATVDEALELRAVGITIPIMLYSLPLPTEVDTLIQHDVIPLVTCSEDIDLYEQAAHAANRQVKVHLKIDTGMGRIGCPPEKAVELAQGIVANPLLVLGGVSTHLACSDTADPGYTRQQIDRFNQTLTDITGSGIDPGIVHAANSGGVIGHPDSWYDMVRPGILAYGYYPSTEQDHPIDVRPVMQLRSQVVAIKQVHPGESISYGATWTASETTHVGTIPVGYGDGYNRLLSNRGSVLIGEEPYPIIGRVCMDQLMVDLGSVCKVSRYDEVIMFGEPPAPTALDLAKLCGTIPYEVTCAISRRVPRMYPGDPVQAEADFSANS